MLRGGGEYAVDGEEVVEMDCSALGFGFLVFLNVYIKGWLVGWYGGWLEGRKE